MTEEQAIATIAEWATAERVIATIAEYAAEIGDQAGVGACETAGWIVSYFAEHPAQLPDFLAGKLSIIDLPLGLHEAGKLSWHGGDGKVHYPAEVRAKRADNSPRLRPIATKASRP